MKFLTKQNSLLKNPINENLDESSTMESALNEKNTKLVKLVYQLKMDNKNLCIPSPTVNKLAGYNLIKMRKKHDVACNKKINSIQNVTTKSLFEELKEILPPIQINHDSTSPTSVSSIYVSQKKSSAQKTTPRILILADSRGRNLANKFRDRLFPNYSVLCIFKPNATFEQTTCDLLGLTLDFNKGDHVIIMAGTNDALVKNYISDNSIEKTVAGLSHTNCLFVAVPYVYHCNYRYFNNLAYKTNYQFQFIANNYSESVKFVDVNRFLGSRHKTLNGLHLNDKVMKEEKEATQVTIPLSHLIEKVSQATDVGSASVKKLLRKAGFNQMVANLIPQ
ncbi:hypothetical protein FQA39_LY03406 [Lamprigera yunnana]|nr:hypothetical protein FQA39_LY03406 [Lamprigera yunnana]